uniref:Uncharacterized protein n=1 Tax=Pseudo-nitzschia australis TaxID=44445 RepID=A0A7S4AVV4_9STRA
MKKVSLHIISSFLVHQYAKALSHLLSYLSHSLVRQVSCAMVPVNSMIAYLPRSRFHDNVNEGRSIISKVKYSGDDAPCFHEEFPCYARSDPRDSAVKFAFQYREAPLETAQRVE